MQNCSYRQTSDTESCEILHENRQQNQQHNSRNQNLNHQQPRQFTQHGATAKDVRTTDSADDDYEDDDYSVENMLDHHHHHMHRNDGNLINDELKYGAGHQSIDSNPVESQSEWSDDECREEAMGK